MTGNPPAPPLRATAGAPRVELEELLHAVRGELRRRDEDPMGSWVEESAADLASGAKPGWYVPGPTGGITFYARQGAAAFGHLHVLGGLGPARRLADQLVRGLPPEVTSLDLGFTGLEVGEERTLVTELAAAPGSTVIERQAMERTLSPADGRFEPDPPRGFERIPVSAVTLDALAQLDQVAFQGSVDELLLGSEPGASRRSLEALLAGRLGRFLGEASAALLEPEPIRLIGAVLNAERSSRTAIVLALMVEPGHRRTGLGRFLLGWSFRALWALGYETARLWVSVRNTPAVTLYRSLGFRTTLEATIYRWDRLAAAHPQTLR